MSFKKNTALGGAKASTSITSNAALINSAQKTALEQAKSSFISAQTPSSQQQQSKLPIATRPSVHNGQLLVSTGVASLDDLIGGGLAVGTTMLVEEDQLTTYAHILLRYYLTEGIAAGHEVMVASSQDVESILSMLPNISGLSEEVQQAASSSTKSNVKSAHSDLSSIADLGASDDPVLDSNASKPLHLPNNDQEATLKIAWRYQNVPVSSTYSSSNDQMEPSHNSSTALGDGKYCHDFDLSQKLPSSILALAKVHTISCLQDTQSELESKSMSLSTSPYGVLYKQVKQICEPFKISGSQTSAGSTRNILRIGIQTLGTPPWGYTGEENERALLSFTQAIRSLVRQCYAVCIITTPIYLFLDSNIQFVQAYRHGFDTVIGLESFAGSPKETNPMFKDYHGLFHLLRLPRLNSLTCAMPTSLDLAFKLRRKKMVIETLHLPPDLSETASRGKEEIDKSGKRRSSSKKDAAELLSSGAQACSSGVSISKSKASLDF